MALFEPEGDGTFPSNFLSTRALMERVMRQRLVRAYPNLELRWGSAVSRLRHGSGAQKGHVTGTACEASTCSP